MKYNLTIGAFKWELDDSVGERELDKDMGLCDYANLKITIKEGMKDQIRKAVVLHELGHAFFASAGFDPREEERVVDIYASQLLGFVQENKEFFKTYFLEDGEDS